MPDRAINTRKKRQRPKRAALTVLPSGRTAEGRRLREFRAALVAHVGGKPSAVQQVLIDRSTVLQAHLTKLDRRAEAEGSLSEHAMREYIAWQNTLTRTLAALGLEGAPAPQQTLQDLLREPDLEDEP